MEASSRLCSNRCQAELLDYIPNETHEKHPEIGVVLTSGFIDDDTVVPENTIAIAKPFTTEHLSTALLATPDHRGSQPDDR